MCGIAGFAGNDRQKMERMLTCLLHRGPDGHGIEALENATLGHARLAILDPSPEADQPMWNDDRTVCIVFNGEIFNYKEIAEQEKFQCRTTSDTEVILKLYEKYRTSFLPRLRGMFAFGIFDTKTDTWTLARDTSGIKPLYVAFPDNKLHFASEMRAIMNAFPSKPALNMRSLSQYLRLQYVPGPETMCEGIESVAPGSVLTWKDGRLTRSTFDTQSYAVEFGEPADFKLEFPGIMDSAVREHLVSDKPVGLFLSGGMDSSIVLHHMAGAIGKGVKTFTVRFEATEAEGAARFNADADLAALTARHYETDHTELTITAADFRDAYDATARALDQPNADHVSVAQFLLAKKAKPSVDVILSGAGGDELFGGYPRYRIAKVLQDARIVPSGLRSLGAKLLGYPADLAAMQPGPALAERLLSRPSKEWTALVRGDWFRPRETTVWFENLWNTWKRDDELRSFMEFDRHTWLVDESLRLADGTTMGSGVEGRIPFLDPRVIAAAHATPSEWHVTRTRTKALLKDTYRQILPDHLFSLHKASFYPPLAKWLRREASPLIEEALAHPRIKELFDAEALRRVADDHVSSRRYGLHVLHGIIQLSHWFTSVYDA